MRGEQTVQTHGEPGQRRSVVRHLTSRPPMLIEDSIPHRNKYSKESSSSSDVLGTEKIQHGVSSNNDQDYRGESLVLFPRKHTTTCQLLNFKGLQYLKTHKEAMACTANSTLLNTCQTTLFKAALFPNLPTALLYFLHNTLHWGEGEKHLSFLFITSLPH